MRQLQKSLYKLYQKIHQVLDQEGLAKEKVLFIDFRDDRLFPMIAIKMAELADVFIHLILKIRRENVMFFR